MWYGIAHVYIVSTYSAVQIGSVYANTTGNVNVNANLLMEGNDNYSYHSDHQTAAKKLPVYKVLQRLLCASSDLY